MNRDMGISGLKRDPRSYDEIPSYYYEWVDPDKTPPPQKTAAEGIIDLVFMFVGMAVLYVGSALAILFVLVWLIKTIWFLV
jgi:hypothetical protein